MIKLFILVVITHVNSGAVVSFQEFASLNQCNYVKEWTMRNVADIGNRVSANCFEK